MKNVSKKFKMILGFNGLNGKWFVLISMFMLVASCSGNRTYISVSEVDTIRFFYLPEGVETQRAISDYRSVVTQQDLLQDTVIYDRTLIEQYIGYINNLKPVRNKNNDFRTYSLIKFKDDREYMELGFGENFDTVVGKQQMKDDPELFEWLHKLLYTGPYKKLPPWVTNEDVEAWKKKRSNKNQ